jgi:hypothetical protein
VAEATPALGPTNTATARPPKRLDSPQAHQKACQEVTDPSIPTTTAATTGLGDKRGNRPLRFGSWSIPSGCPMIRSEPHHPDSRTIFESVVPVVKEGDAVLCRPQFETPKHSLAALSDAPAVVYGRHQVADSEFAGHTPTDFAGVSEVSYLLVQCGASCASSYSMPHSFRATRARDTP